MVPVPPWPYNDQPAGLALPDFGLPADEGARLRDRIRALLGSRAGRGRWSTTGSCTVILRRGYDTSNPVA